MAAAPRRGRSLRLPGRLLPRGGLGRHRGHDRPAHRRKRRHRSFPSCLRPLRRAATAAPGPTAGRRRPPQHCLRYDLILPGLSHLGLPIPLGGTSNHFRTNLLRELGGWDAWNVTEDADLGLRCAARGYRVSVVDSVTWAEATDRVKPWVRQRTRWLKGFLLTTLVHTRHPARTLRRFGLSGMVTLLLVVGGTPVLPPCWILQWVAAWRALIQLIRAPYLWEKTPHGIAETFSTEAGAQTSTR